MVRQQTGKPARLATVPSCRSLSTRTRNPITSQLGPVVPGETKTSGPCAAQRTGVSENREFPSLDDSFEGGGPHIAKGRYFYELPWPKRDLKRSKAELQPALQRAPNNPRAWLYLAETLLKDDDPKAAKEAIDRIAAAKGTRDPAEERRVRQRAKAVAEKINEALK